MDEYQVGNMHLRRDALRDPKFYRHIARQEARELPYVLIALVLAVMISLVPFTPIGILFWGIVLGWW